MSEFWPLIALKRGPHGFRGCSRVGWCSPLQIFLEGDLPKKSIARAYSGLHAYTRGQRFTRRSSDTVVCEPAPDMHRNSSNRLKGGAAGLLATRSFLQIPALGTQSLAAGDFDGVRVERPMSPFCSAVATIRQCCTRTPMGSLFLQARHGKSCLGSCRNRSSLVVVSDPGRISS